MSKNTQKNIWLTIEKVKKKSPLVHNITNYVAMNYTANILLSAGASPVMAHAKEEVEDMVKIAQSVVLNIGTLSEPWVKSMTLSLQAAKRYHKPIVFDPVGAGATPYRNTTITQLFNLTLPNVIRGNASEIIALCNHTQSTKGVDNTLSVDKKSLHIAENTVKKYNNIICISGAVDYIISPQKKVALHNGHPLMTQVTAMGCAASALIGAFVGVEQDHFLATISAMSLISVVGEIAAEKSSGPGSFAINIIDIIHNISQNDFDKRLKIQILS